MQPIRACSLVLLLLVACAVDPSTAATSQPAYIVTTANNSTVTLPAGVTTSVLLIRHHGVTVQGAGRELTSLVGDGVNRPIVFPYPPQTPDGQPITTFHLRDITLDASTAALTAVSGAGPTTGPLLYEVDRVRVTGTAATEWAFAFTAVEVDVNDVQVYGDGRAFSFNGTTGTVDNVIIEGGQGGFIVADGGSPTSVEISNVTGRADYWQGPASSGAMEATGFGATYADVVDAQPAKRSAYDVVRVATPVGLGDVIATDTVAVTGLAPFDRVETTAGVWSQVERTSSGGAIVGPWHQPNSWNPATAPAPATPVVGYRLVLGRLWPGTWTSTRLGVYRWRYVDGRAAPTPTLAAGQRVDVRHASRVTGIVRDVDVGAVHFTAPCSNCAIRDAYFRGYFSDQVTLRGTNSTAERVVVEMGQDMGFTMDGDGAMCSECRAYDNGVNGICVVTSATNATIVNADVRGNGTQATPGNVGYSTWAWGIYAYGPVDVLSAGGFDNANGLVRYAP